MKRRYFDFDTLRLAACAWLGKRVLVLGDMILDEFVYGRTERISREAPVVIVRYQGTEWHPGGAANAAQNVVSLGGAALPVSVIGSDPGGERLRELLRSRGMTARGLVSGKGLATTTKTRVMAGDYHAQWQQVVRIDREEEAPLERRIEDRLLAAFARELPRAGAVLLSDYHQRLFTDRVIGETTRRCRALRVPVVVDSRFRLERFRGITTAVPNEVEAARAAGFDIGNEVDVDRIGARLLRRLDAGSVLVTRGKFGMALYEAGGRRSTAGIVGSPEATDVTGAGDTVAAAVALSLAAGHGMELAMHLANVAASIVVMKRGTVAARLDEVLGAIDALERAEGSPRD